MALVIRHTNRNGLVFAHLKSSLFLPKLGKLHSYRLGKFHSTLGFSNQQPSKIGPFPLSSAGIKSEINITEKENLAEFDNLKHPKKVYSRKSNPVKKKVVKDLRVQNALEIAGAPFSASTFSELDLSPLLVDRLAKQGLTVPTDVQFAAVPTILQNHDTVIQSYTGSGKTLAYILPILSSVGPLKKASDETTPEQKQGIEAVVVAPSRELGMQIVREAEKLLGPDKMFVQQLVGGANRSRQEEALKKNKPAIVVGTPGRIAEILAAGKLHTHGCRFLVLDEIDQLLSFNYREDMHRILEHVGRRSSSVSSGVLGPLSKRFERQTILVSATVTFSVIRAARSWCRRPLLVRDKSVAPLGSVSVTEPATSASDVDASSTSGPVTKAVDSLPPALEHYYSISKPHYKTDMVRRCIHALDANSVIVFVNNTHLIKDVVHKLEARGVKAGGLHGDLGKLARTTTLKKFKDGDLRVLVANELSARGLDVAECDLVVNLELPTDSIHYAHRAGRTGRLGRKGTVVSICDQPEAFVFRKLSRQLGLTVQPCEFSGGKLVLCNEDDLI